MRASVRITGKIMPKMSMPSPAALNPFDLPTIVQMIQQLGEMHKEVLAAVTKVTALAESITAIKQGPQGVPGTQGLSVDHEEVVADVLKQIRQPVDGKSPSVEALAAALLPKMTAFFKKNIPVVTPAPPRKDAEPVDINAVVDAFFEALKNGDRKLTMAHIDGLDGKVAEIRNHVATTLQGKQYGKDTWARGGGDTVAPGTNVTFGRDANGNKVINANASGGITIIAVTGTVDDSNLIFSAATQPKLLNINGAFYQKTGGAYTWTYAAGSITLNNPVGTGGSIFGI